jgi:site-specific recombinase XerD
VYLPKQRNVSENTVKSYRETLNQFLGYLCERQGIPLADASFDLITCDSVKAYLDWIEQDLNDGIATRNQRLSSVRAFISHTASRDLSLQMLNLELKNIPKKKAEKPLKLKYFEEEALEALLIQPDTKKASGIRDRFLMILMYDTGGRIQEILELKVGDLHLDSRQPFVVLTGKGCKTRHVPIMDKTVQHLVGYMSVFHRAPLPGDFLFYVVQHERIHQLSQDAVSKLLSKYCAKARKSCAIVPDHLTAHMFRHARSMHLYRNGMPLPLLAEWLGHENIETTLIYYANANTKMKQEAIGKATSFFNPMRMAPIVDIANDENVLKRLYGLANSC